MLTLNAATQTVTTINHVEERISRKIGFGRELSSLAHSPLNDRIANAL
jgi:hypothetical protein